MRRLAESVGMGFILDWYAGVHTGNRNRSHYIQKIEELAVCREASRRGANDLRADGEDGLLAEAHLRNTLVPTYRAGS